MGMDGMGVYLGVGDARLHHLAGSACVYCVRGIGKGEIEQPCVYYLTS